MSAALPRIAITLGDPAGIGPEVILKALREEDVRACCRPVVVGDCRVLRQAAEQTGARVDLQPVSSMGTAPRPSGDCRLPIADCRLPESGLRKIANRKSQIANRPQHPFPTGEETEANVVHVLDLANADPASFVQGEINAACGRAAIESIRTAVRLCQEGQAEAMVTAPIHKEAAARAGLGFPGHTEFITALCGAADTRMLLVSDRLRVLHVTTHLSLRQACEVSVERVQRTLELGHDAMRQLGFLQPRMAVCGLNPHAGEHGLFGNEEAQVIEPALAAARQQGIAAFGPFPADTIFLKAVRGEYDLVVAMYHDQGHIPLKLLAFDTSVNVTVGLPILRTSVDHGTGFDIVGRNQASPGSMIAALKLAATMARHQRET